MKQKLEEDIAEEKECGGVSTELDNLLNDLVLHLKSGNNKTVVGSVYDISISELDQLEELASKIRKKL
ncbi:TPA: hypothetical protein ACIKY6_001890 [Campylobacter jejuni]